MTQDHATSYYDNARVGMLKYIDAGARRILEVGCGHGRFGALLKSVQDAHVTGIDISAEAIEVSRTKLDIAFAIDLDATTLPFGPGSFDCIVCNDVLEHLVDPWRVVSQLAGSLEPGGRLVASIPNIRHHKVLRRLIWPGEWQYADIGILDRTHLRFFTRSSMRHLVESAGLEVALIEGINPRAFPFWLKALNFVGGNFLDDMRWVQFAIVGVKPAA